jgi:hypothetical protein
LHRADRRIVGRAVIDDRICGAHRLSAQERAQREYLGAGTEPQIAALSDQTSILEADPSQPRSSAG